MIRKILGTIWALPITLIGLILIPIYGPVKFTISDWTLLISVKKLWGPKGVVGANFGSVIFIKEKHGLSDERLEGVIDHEFVHRDQCYFFGVFTILLYALGTAHAAYTPDMHYYKDNFMECQAQKIARK